MAGENQYSTIKAIGDISYPPLWIRSADGTINLVAKYIFLKDYAETYKPDYDFEHIFGNVNIVPGYSTTDRTISISFNLGARNVHESKKNLTYCETLARSPYGVYEVARYNADTGAFEYDYNHQRRYVVNFGTFLRDQTVEVLSFDFSIDFDAGVFDYGSTPIGLQSPEGGPPATIGARSDAHWEGTEGPSSLMQEDAYVYHGERGAVFPKMINVTLSMRAFHDVPLGFGGQLRPEGSLGWSLNENLDWPHGTGQIAASRYCQRDVPAAPVEQAPNHGTTSEDIRDEASEYAYSESYESYD